MMRSLYLKTLYDKRFFMLGWSLGFAALAALMVAFFPAMNQDGALDALVKSMPPALQGLVGDLAALTEFPTYLASQLFDIRMPIIAGVMAIVIGLALSVSEEEKGELRTLLALPLSRVSILLQKWLAMVTIMLVAVIGLIVGLYASIPLTEGADIEAQSVLKLSAMTLLVMIALGTVPFALGFMSGKRAIASGVSILIVVGSFLLSTFAGAVDWLADYEFISLLYYFPAVEIVSSDIDLKNVAVLGGLSLLLLGVAALLFRRRDVG